MLPYVYSESEIYMKWKQRSKKTESEQLHTLDKESKVIITGKYCTYCLSTRQNIVREHTDATCYFLHPERKKKKDERQRENTKQESERARRDKKISRAKEAHVAVAKATRDEIKESENQIAFMSCLLREKADSTDENA